MISAGTRESCTDLLPRPMSGVATGNSLTSPPPMLVSVFRALILIPKHIIDDAKETIKRAEKKLPIFILAI